MVKGTAHYAFSDLVDVVDVLGIAGELPDAAVEMIGTMKGGRALEVVTRYLEVFFRMWLKRGRGELFDGPTSAFPEVTFGNP